MYVTSLCVCAKNKTCSLFVDRCTQCAFSLWCIKIIIEHFFVPFTTFYLVKFVVPCPYISTLNFTVCLFNVMLFPCAVL